MGEVEGRWLDPKAAAAYLHTTTRDLPNLVESQRIPAPSYRLGPRKPRWDRHSLDAAMLEALGIKPKTDITTAVERACEQMQESRRKSRSKAAGGRNDQRISLS